MTTKDYIKERDAVYRKIQLSRDIIKNLRQKANTLRDNDYIDNEKKIDNQLEILFALEDEFAMLTDDFNKKYNN